MYTYLVEAEDAVFDLFLINLEINLFGIKTVLK